MADYNETLRALRRDAAELERIAGGTGAYWTGAAAENFRRPFTAQTCLNMNDTTKNMRTAEQLAALADTLERQAAAPLDEAAAALHLAWQSDAAVQFLRRQQAVTDDLRAAARTLRQLAEEA